MAAGLFVVGTTTPCAERASGSRAVASIDDHSTIVESTRFRVEEIVDLELPPRSRIEKKHRLK